MYLSVILYCTQIPPYNSYLQSTMYFKIAYHISANPDNLDLNLDSFASLTKTDICPTKMSMRDVKESGTSAKTPNKACLVLMQLAW